MLARRVGATDSPVAANKSSGASCKLNEMFFGTAKFACVMLRDGLILVMFLNYQKLYTQSEMCFVSGV
jgi:hypothetical protein